MRKLSARLHLAGMEKERVLIVPQCQAIGVCRNCIVSASGNVALGEKICFRYTLVDLGFGAGGVYPHSIVVTYVDCD